MPECRFVSIFRCDSPTAVDPYDEERVQLGVAYLLEQLGFDADQIGHPGWNPMREVVRPGDVVVLKPNFVKEHHLHDPTEWESIVTHGSVIKAVVHYVERALDGQGKIVITDGPQTDSSFDRIVEVTGIRAFVEDRRKTASVPIELIDLRQEEWTEIDGVIVKKRLLPGDPLGYTKVSLNDKSEFADHGPKRYYGAAYDIEETNQHHYGSVHEYMISSTALDCDVFINLPKLKTHKKAGVTLNLKNLVGINGNKNWLPHHSEGTPATGGDQFPDDALKSRLEQRIMARVKHMLRDNPLLSRAFVPFKRMGRRIFGDTEEVVRSGNWFGNDTVWRMALDLNKAMFFYDRHGQPRPGKRRFFSLVDGIIAGEGNGPMAPERRAAGILIAGLDAVAVDCAAAWIMGFDYERIPLLREAFATTGLPITDLRYDAIALRSNEPLWNGRLVDLPSDVTLRFKPHFGWRGRIELPGDPVVRRQQSEII